MALMVSVTLFAERVSQDDAALVANNFMNVRSSSNVKKALPAKKMVRKATATEDLYYLYENANGEGWVIVAANDAMTPILAYSETGHFRTDNMPVNIKKWLGKYNDFTRKLEADGVVASEEAQNEWKALRKGARKATASVVVGPLIQTTWDQGEPFWNQCPSKNGSRAYTGCVATAMAQVMKYWNWPVQGTGSKSYRPLDPNSDYYDYGPYGTQSADFGATTYDWDNMLNAYTYLDSWGTDHVLSGLTNAQKDAVATLMYHCGVASEMMYGDADAGGSGTLTVNYNDWTMGVSTTDQGGCAQNALWAYFGYKQDSLIGYMRDGYSYKGTKYYDSWTDAAWTAMVKAELDKQRPIMYDGAGEDGGHSFICDGYRTDNYFHFNWGWSGQNDGYYTLSNLKPGSGGAGGGSYDFSESQGIIIGIVPDRDDIEPGEPVHITWSVNGVEGEPVEVEKGKLITLPADPTCACGKVFVGWTALTSINPNTEPSDLFTTNAGKIATADITYYAVFADVEAGGSGESAFDGQTSGNYKIYAIVDGVKHYATITNNNKLQSSTDASEATDFTFTKVSGGFTVQNGNKYIRNSSTTNITAGNQSFVWGVTAGTKGTWRLTSEQESRALIYRASTYNVFGGYSTSNVTATGEYYDLEIGDGQGGASYSNYSKSCDCGTESVVNAVLVAPKAVKIIENGQIVIIRDNEKYSIVGQKIQ